MIDRDATRWAISQGESIPKNITSITLTNLLQQAATSDQGIVHLNEAEEVYFQSYQKLLTQAESILSGLRNLGLKPQSKVFLQLSQSQNFVVVFWGCILGGFIPIPVAVAPDYTTDNSKANILRYGWELITDKETDRECIVVTDESLREAITVFGKKNSLLNFHLVIVEDLLVAARDTNYYVRKLDELALILLTSGSTGKPKGVMLTERNLLASVYGMAQVNHLTSDDITLNWMPMEHVASLVMFHLTEVYLGCQQIQVNHRVILQQPLKWLDLIDRYRVSVTWSPNFGYGLVCDKLSKVSDQNWDLSWIKWMGNGAEAVVGKTTRKFLQLLAPFGLASNAVSPGYGMSETCSGIVHSQDFSLATTTNEDQFITLGSPIPGIAIRIVDGEDNLLEEEKIGLLQVKGETVTSGYYGQPELTHNSLTQDGWFKTGDLGFIQAGKLVITGRQKDVIIINSVNYYNQEIESVVEEVSGVVVSYTAACGVRKQADNTDKIAIFFCPQSFSEEFLIKLVNAIRKTVVSKIGINPEYIIPLETKDLPKTAIGKIQRQQLKQKFIAGEFDSIIIRLKSAIEQERSLNKKLPRNELENKLVTVWKEVLQLDDVGIDNNFFELGGNSILLMEVLGKLQAFLDKSLSPVTLFQQPTIASLSKYLTQETPQLQITSRRKTQTPDIAVIGMACRFPGAKNLDEFWYNLTQGIESISFFSEAEIAASGIDRELINHPDYVKASPILEDIEYFDAKFFGYSPKEAELIDPQQRLLLECAWECLEDAGYDPNTYPGAIALYAGTATNTYLLNNIYPNRHQLDRNDSLDTFTLTSMGGFQTTIANDKDYLTTRVSYKLNLTGASVNVQTACSTSLTTVHLACQSLINGECDMALAGGVSITVPQKAGYLYQEGMILSPDGHCRAFDAAAGGTIFGSGAGIVLLKPLDKAIQDRDRIYALIKGSAINNDGGAKVGYLAPNSIGQAKAVAEAIAISDIVPESISYLEAHGTGTILGDPIEIAGLTQAFRHSTSKTQFCAIGSVKTNVGHLQIASGIVGLIKTVLCLYHKQLPPSLHYNHPNSQIDFSNSPFYVNTSLIDWKVAGYPLRAGVNSLGIGGTNVHVILEETPQVVLQKRSNKTVATHLFTISAKNQQALIALKAKYCSYLGGKQDNLTLEDICFTANLGRSHFQYRFAVVTDSITDLQDKLSGVLNDVSDRNSDNNNRIAFLFTGQGSQYLNMGKKLYETQTVFRNSLNRCAEILQDYLDENLLDIIFNDTKNDNQKIRVNKLDDTQNTQPILFSLEYALAQLWISWGITPSIVLGHSLGEYVAATIADVFSLEAGLKLVVARSNLMAKLPTNSVMYAVFTSLETVTSFLENYRETVTVAVVNSHNNIVLSGDEVAVSKIIKQLTTAGISVKQLGVSHAFHSPLMQPILKEFKQVAETINYNLPKINIISNLTGKIITSEIATAQYWCDHILQPVQFFNSVKTLITLDTNILIECGAKPTLLNLVNDIIEASDRENNSSYLLLPSLSPKHDDTKLVLDSLAKLYIRGIEINWYNFYQDCNYHKVSLPTYPFQRQKYWIERRQEEKKAKYSVNKLHPLVGEKLNSAIKQVVFQSVINTVNLPFLEDHKINGEIIFPATAYLEMMLVTGRNIFNSSAITLAEVEFRKTLVVTPQTDITLQLITSPKDNYSEIEIYSLSGEEWILHCCGKVNNSIVTSENNLQQIQQFPDEISPEIHYQQCRQRNINYGQSFQGISKISPKNQDILGKITIPQIIASEILSYYFHPALLDACLQLIFAALPEKITGITYIPVKIAKLCFYQQHQNTDLWSKVKLKKFTSNTPSTITANAEIYDIKGEIIATVTGITLQKINHKLNSDVPVWNDWLYQIIWQEQSLNINNCLATTQENYLIVTADSKLGNKIVSALKNQHQECSLIYLNKEHQKITDCHYSLNSDIAAEYNIVYQKITKTCSPDKIIYLAALDNNNTETIALSQASQLSEIVTKQCSQLLFLTQTLIQNSTAKPPRLYIVTNNHSITQSPLWGMGKTIALEYPELNCTLYDYDALDTEIQPLLIDICNPTEETQIVYRHGKRQVARLVKQPITKLAQKLIISDRGTLANLQWKTVTPQTPQKGEVTIQVVATGLNFRDVLNTLNMYPKEAGELGLECSGVITAVGEEVNNLQVGDKVLAIATGSFSSYVTVNAHLVIPLPSSLSFTEAATIPTAFLTAYYCLHHLAAIKPGDKILIHSAAGGVGLAAVQICQQIGAEIFATASPSKWQYLQTLGINHIMNSRNLDFAEEILSITQGEGINIVLNSLAGEYIPKSLAVLKPQGCFIEIGKNDLWNQNQVSQIKPQVTYHKTDLFSITQEQPQLIQTLLSQLISQFANKTLQPLKYTTFSDSEIVTAFRYMQQAKHIGKIVILNESVNRNLTISSESSYLITGGLGALGLEVAQWLVSKGAKHLLLVGRNQPSAKAKVIIKQLETTGATIQIIQGDIANPETIDQIFFITDYPLKGIIHAAGVIQDKTILNQTPEDFQAVINPKILGVWNLHQATQNLPLDFFVMFSSAASLLGSPGQINYAAANAFLDSFAHYRHSLGLPALSINWSAWNDLGLAATNTPQTPGMQSILPQEGIAILESLLTSSLPQVGVLPIDSKQWQINSPFSENFQQTLTKTNFRDTLNNLSETEIYHQLVHQVVTEVAEVLGINNIDAISLDIGFTDLGLDSLSSVELRNRLQTTLHCNLPSTLTYEFPTITSLVEYLVKKLNLSSVNQGKTLTTISNIPDKAEITNLSEAEAEALLLAELDNFTDLR